MHTSAIVASRSSATRTVHRYGSRLGIPMALAALCLSWPHPALATITVTIVPGFVSEDGASSGGSVSAAQAELLRDPGGILINYGGYDATFGLAVAGLSGERRASVPGAFVRLTWDISDQGATFDGHGRSTNQYASAFASANILVSVAGAGTNGLVRYNLGGQNEDYQLLYGYQSYFPNVGSGSPGEGYFSGSIVWTDNGIFPGETKLNPRKYGPEMPTRSDEPVDVAGYQLTSLPVDGSFGVTSPVFFGTRPAAIASSAFVSDSAAPGATDYVFRSQSDLAFTSFVTPDGIPGDTSHIFIDDGTRLTPYVPGTTVLFASPVSEFFIRGLDPFAMPSHGPVPFVHGMTFDQSGTAIVLHGALVPEPSSVLLSLIGATGLVFVLRRHSMTGRVGQGLP